MKFLNRLSILPFCAIFLFGTVKADVSAQERIFAERVAMREMDKKCDLFRPNERGAVNAFVLQARGDILRSSDNLDRVNLLIYQAKQGVVQKDCNNKVVKAEAKNLVDAYYAWRSQNIIEYKGVKNKWTASRAGVDNWRVWQEVGDETSDDAQNSTPSEYNGVKFGYILADNGLALAVETTDKNYRGARVYLRNFYKMGYPSIKDGGNPPMRAGTDSYMTSYILPAQTKPQVNAETIDGKLFVFPQIAAVRTATLDPRDYFEVELFDAYGNTQSYTLEVGNLISAFVFGAQI